MYAAHLYLWELYRKNMALLGEVNGGINRGETPRLIDIDYTSETILSRKIG